MNSRLEPTLFHQLNFFECFNYNLSFCIFELNWIEFLPWIGVRCWSSRCRLPILFSEPRCYCNSWVQFRFEALPKYSAVWRSGNVGEYRVGFDRFHRDGIRLVIGTLKIAKKLRSFFSLHRLLLLFILLSCNVNFQWSWWSWKMTSFKGMFDVFVECCCFWNEALWYLGNERAELMGFSEQCLKFFSIFFTFGQLVQLKSAIIWL